jgi:hypothetical protein
MKTLYVLIWSQIKKIIGINQEWISNTISSIHQSIVGAANSTSDIAPPPQTTEAYDNEICTSIASLRNKLQISRFNKFEREHLSWRLQNLSNLLAGNEYPKSAAIELHQSFHPAEIEYRLASSIEKKAHIAILEVVRNVLVLLPILLTWISLSIASKNYAAALEIAPEPERTEMFQLPFLLLWEQDFQEFGSANIANWRPTFSEVAEWDAVIIAFALILTAYFHWQTDFTQTTITAAAAEIRSHLEQILWETSQLFSVAYFKQVSTSTNLINYTDALSDGTEKLSDAAAKIGTASSRLSEFQNIASKIQDQQSTLLQTIQHLTTEVQTLGTTAKQSAHNASSTANTAIELANMTEGLLKHFDTVTDALNLDRDQNKSFAAEMRQVAGSLKDNATRTEESFREFGKNIGDKLWVSMTGIEVAAGDLGDKMDGSLKQSTWALEETAATLNKKIDSVQNDLQLLSKDGYSLPKSHPRTGLLLVIFGAFQILLMAGIAWLIHNLQIMVKFV